VSNGLSKARNATIVLSVGYSSLQDALYDGTADGVYRLAPVGLSAPLPETYTARASDLSATLQLSPDRAGLNRLTLSLRDTQERPVARATVSVLTTQLGMPMGTGVVVFHQVKPGAYVGSGDLGMGGDWRLNVLVFRASGLTRMSVRAKVRP